MKWARKFSTRFLLGTTFRVLRTQNKWGRNLIALAIACQTVAIKSSKSFLHTITSVTTSWLIERKGYTVHLPPIYLCKLFIGDKNALTLSTYINLITGITLCVMTKYFGESKQIQTKNIGSTKSNCFENKMLCLRLNGRLLNQMHFDRTGTEFERNYLIFLGLISYCATANKNSRKK